ncbi:u14-Nephitoxin-Nsp1b_1 [Nephila pilipes]|uniref:U14-Nephitoxin-Nsp1b_1 n=1 Tax=Nephila pilipes TaxID=299642 RepID=A0A8X6QXH0_NEPPI|nr:u14-Nephitoxin-Nsp1b_1 [Nephila pilipes]
MAMKLILFTFFAIFALSEVSGFFNDRENGPRRGRFGGWGGHGGWRPYRLRSSPMLFPKCKEIMNAVQEKMKENGCGLFSCRNAADMDECMYQERLKARNQLDLEPTDDCVQQMVDFLLGVPEEQITNSTAVETEM